MTDLLLHEIVKLSRGYVQKKGGRPSFEVEHAIADLLHLSRLDLYLQYDRVIFEEEKEAIRKIVSRLADGEPLAYIQEKAFFYKNQFFVSPDVLIPRVETELLIEVVCAELSQRKISGTIVDVCCGSGCIGLTLKKLFPSWHVILADISEKALSVAERNAKELELDVEIVHGDLLEPLYTKKIDILVSNPPYISSEEMRHLDPSVKKFEPHLALEAGPTGLEIYKRIFSMLPCMQYNPAFYAFEIGETQGKDVSFLFSSRCRVTVHQDFRQKDRVVACSRLPLFP